jgi:glycosyltransferase involved in cell wall biosynthesis
MIGIAIPVHNEEERLGACLRAALDAARHPRLRGEAVQIVAVLDSCDDHSAAVARDFGVDAIEIEARNVGIARAAGADRLLARGARWLAFTDADSRVAPDWLAAQLALRAQAVCGPVVVDDWTPHHERTRAAFYRAYMDADGHRHIHGANIGVSARAYRRAGGFPPLWAACMTPDALAPRRRGNPHATRCRYGGNGKARIDTRPVRELNASKSPSRDIAMNGDTQRSTRAIARRPASHLAARVEQQSTPRACAAAADD